MRINLIGKIIFAITICFSVIEIGMTISFYMFTNMDFNLFNNDYVYEIRNN